MNTLANIFRIMIAVIILSLVGLFLSFASPYCGLDFLTVVPTCYIAFFACCVLAPITKYFAFIVAEKL